MIKACIITLTTIALLSTVACAPATEVQDSNEEQIFTSTKTEVFADTDDVSIPFEEQIEEGEQRYTLGEVTYEVVSTEEATEPKTVTHTETIEGLSTQSAEPTETITVNQEGQAVDMTVADISYTDTTVTGRTTALEAFTDFNLQVIAPTPQPSKIIEHTDPENGNTTTVTLPFSHLETVTDWHWRDDVSIPITFSVYNAEYYAIGDTLVPYNPDTPALAGQEATILSMVGLNTDQYRITSFSWDGAPYQSGDTTLRNAVAHGERYVAGYRAVYADTISLLDLPQYTATVTYEGTVQVPTGEVLQTVEATALYHPVVSAFPVAMVVTAGIVGLLLAVLFVGLLFILKKKREEKEREAQTNVATKARTRGAEA